MDRTVPASDLRRSVCLSLLFLVASGAAFAQNRPVRLRPGTPDRKYIQPMLDAVRPSIERLLKKRVVFKVNRVTMQNGWAFLDAEPRLPDGSPMDYHGTRYQEAFEHGGFGGEVDALFHRRGSRWTLVKYVLGATDVAWYDWDKKYGAPSGIFKVY